MHPKTFFGSTRLGTLGSNRVNLKSLSRSGLKINHAQPQKFYCLLTKPNKYLIILFHLNSWLVIGQLLDISDLFSKSLMDFIFGFEVSE